MERKNGVDTRKAKEILARLNEVPEPVVPLRQFLTENFEILEQSGRKLKDLYAFFSANGLNVGGLRYFREEYNRIKSLRKDNPSAMPLPEQQSAASAQAPAVNLPVIAASPACTTMPVSSPPVKPPPAKQAKAGIPPAPVKQSKAENSGTEKTAERSQDTDASKEANRPLLYGEKPLVREDGRKINIDSEGKVTFGFRD